MHPQQKGVVTSVSALSTSCAGLRWVSLEVGLWGMTSESVHGFANGEVRPDRGDWGSVLDGTGSELVRGAVALTLVLG